MPSKVKVYIGQNLTKEIYHFKKKFKLEFNIIADETLGIPEYKIDLLNKNKKIIKKIENIEKIEKIEKVSSNKYYRRQNFIYKKNNKNFKSKDKFKYYSKIKKNNSPNKKAINY